MAATALATIPKTARYLSRAFSLNSALRSQRRWFDWDPHVSKRDGKPAITGTKHVYVAGKIPVVLLRDIEGLGQKGSILEVKRGFARNVLVPKGLAVYGTVWENVDAYADPKIGLKQEGEKSTLDHGSTAVPFEWLNSVRIEFVRESVSSTNMLVEPVNIFEILSALSTQEQIDFLPAQVSLPPEGILTLGKHVVEVQLDLKVGNFRYKIKVDIKDKAELAAAERREADLREAMKVKRPEFILGKGRLSGFSKQLDTDNGDEDSDSE